MRAYRSTSHSSPLDAPRFLMLGQETRVSEHLTYHLLTPESNDQEYVDELITRMRMAHEVLREQQWQLRSGNFDNPPLSKVGDWVRMSSHRWRHGQAAML